MKFLCLGYFSPERMDARPREEIAAVIAECKPHLETLYAEANVLLDVGLVAEARTLRRERGEIEMTDGPYVGGHAMIGSAFILEAADLTEAIRLASLHPSLQVRDGEQLGWGIEVRPVHYYKTHAPASDEG